ncbi:hypothetical protein PQX77_010238 [Marasmius sp. AFHP31]|nr:hypothetical protein PQX77_010238 [Marasmius sp. AFHP31]
MAWAHARFSGQQALLNKYYSTLRNWAEYLILSNAVNPPNGTQTADGLHAKNMTNLAIKAIIGVRSMADISYTLGKGDDALRYQIERLTLLDLQNQSSSWIEGWKVQAFSSGHLASVYGVNDSWSLMYNIYADKLLRMNLVGDDIYDAQDKFYGSQYPSSEHLALGPTTHELTLPDATLESVGFTASVLPTHLDFSDWTMLTAATIKDTAMRDFFITMVREKAVDNSNFGAFPTSYNSQDGRILSGSASPAQGAVYGLLTLNLESRLPGLSGNTSGGGSNGPDSQKEKFGSIIGAVVGSLAALALLIFGILLYYRRKQNRPRDLEERRCPLAWLLSGGGNNSPISTGNNHIEPFTTPLSTTCKPWPHGSGQSSDMPDAVQPGHHSGRPVPPLPRASDPTRIDNPPSVEDIARHTADNNPQSILPSTAGGSTNVVSQLHHDIESLRRDMEEMRLRTMYVPPPEYATMCNE